MSKKVYVLYDARAADGNTDDAAVLEAGHVSDGLPKKSQVRRLYGEGVLFLYDVAENGIDLINEKMEWTA